VAPQLQAAAMPELARLAEEAGATATLTVADGEEAVALVVVEPRHRAILVARPPASGEPEVVAADRARGYSVSSGEIQPGASGLAAPIPGADASIGVVSFGEPDESLAARVIAAAAAVAEELGPPRAS